MALTQTSFHPFNENSSTRSLVKIKSRSQCGGLGIAVESGAAGRPTARSLRSRTTFRQYWHQSVPKQTDKLGVISETRRRDVSTPVALSTNTKTGHAATKPNPSPGARCDISTIQNGRPKFLAQSPFLGLIDEGFGAMEIFNFSKNYANIPVSVVVYFDFEAAHFVWICFQTFYRCQFSLFILRI